MVPDGVDALPGHAAWVAGRYKLHRLAGREGADATYELYDLADDPAETTDLADGQPERVARMKAALERWQRSVVESLKGEDY